MNCSKQNLINQLKEKLQFRVRQLLALPVSGDNFSRNFIESEVYRLTKELRQLENATPNE
jgi:hypothetical protein